MNNYRATLGLPDSAGAEDIKKAYRKLAMLHHPDRGGNEEIFKTIKAAYEALEVTGFAPFQQPRPRPQAPPKQNTRPESPSGSWQNDSINDIYNDLKATRAGPQRNNAYVQPNSEIIIDVSLREAARGFSTQISRQKQNGFVEHIDVVIPAGLPDGHRGRYTLSDGSMQVVVLRIVSNPFKVRGLSNTVGTIFEAGITTGDIELDVDIDAIDLITGAWIEVFDFMGEKLTVRVPAGFHPDQRLKVAGKGYNGWIEDQQIPTRGRRDMYVKLRPIYNSPDKIPREKIKRLYDSVGGWDDDQGQN